MEAFSIQQKRLIGSSRCISVHDEVVTMTEKRLGYSETVETPINQVHPKATHVRHSVPKFLLIGVLLLTSALAFVVVALQMANFETGGLIVLLAVVFGVLGEQMLETFFETKRNELIYYNMMTGAVAVVLRCDKPNKRVFDEFLQRFSKCLPELEATDVLPEDHKIASLRTARQMLAEGLITQADYERIKEEVLSIQAHGKPKIH